MRVHNELTLGIDEAGRGPILGPMVMAAVALKPRQAAVLTRAGVADSKRFSGDGAHAARLQLRERILRVADFVAVAVIDVETIDTAVRQNGLNRLEQSEARTLIARAPGCRRIVCDGERLFAPLRAQHSHLEALNRGEEAHAAVAAASIVAKVRRDELWLKISRRYLPRFGALCARGGGYVNLATKTFLRAYIEAHGTLPPEARRSWPWDFARDLLRTEFDRYRDLPASGQLHFAALDRHPE